MKCCAEDTATLARLSKKRGYEYLGMRKTRSSSRKWDEGRIDNAITIRFIDISDERYSVEVVAKVCPV
ncbi:hypothetical protein TWF481_003252 [Arthrobotrys musiformis]|uniref:Uncharacterized protein n=1 Tax=Arthrobotrys musiformis TaxID=47236 RepID=A0AAV9VPQ1_9PEZI